MKYWLVKSEPFKWSWQMQKAKGKAGQEWDGVRNYQARNYMREMNLGDQVFFYHSNEGLEVAGVAEVSALVHPDSTTDDKRWECVDIRALVDIPIPVPLPEIKANPKLAEMVLVTNTRLSVQPVSRDEWMEVCRMGGLNGATLKPL
jgi:predicted RNA-binding protein with PUA-like domain